MAIFPFSVGISSICENPKGQTNEEKPARITCEVGLVVFQDFTFSHTYFKSIVVKLNAFLRVNPSVALIESNTFSITCGII